MEMVRISFSLSPRTVGNMIPEIGGEVKIFLEILENIQWPSKRGQRPTPGETGLNRPFGSFLIGFESIGGPEGLSLLSGG